MMKKTRIPLFQRDKDKDRQIGRPTLVETTYNQDHLRNASNLHTQSAHPRVPRFLTHPYEQQEQRRSPNALVPPPKPFGNEVHISARKSSAPTEYSVYSQGQSNCGYDYYPHPTAQTGTDDGNPSPPISPLVGATANGSASIRSVSPIREPLPRSVAPPRTPEQPQSRFSFATSTRTSPASSSWQTMPTQSRFSMSTTASPESKYSLERSTALPQSKFSADSTPQSIYSSQFSYAPTSRYQAPIPARQRVASVGSVAESVATVATDVTAATTRKPVPQRAASPALSIQTNAMKMTNATTKDLPQPPVVVDPSDRSSVLQAEMDDLWNQKANTEKAIQHLKKPQAQDPRISDIASRRAAVRREQELEEQLWDITSKMQACGVSLIKANKRKYQDDPKINGFWVRKATLGQERDMRPVRSASN